MRDASPSTPARVPWQLLTLALTLLLLPAALRGGLVLDDRELIFENPAVSGQLPLLDALGRDYFHHLADAGTWRPLATLSLRMDHSLFGPRVWLYHLSNLLLHGLVAGLVLRLLVPAARSRWSLLAAVGVFALHPALCDSSVWIAGRTSMLSAIPPLLGLTWLRSAGAPAASSRKVALVACLGLLGGLLAKEDALAFAPLLLAAVWRDPARRRGAFMGLLLAVLIYLVGRWAALGGPFVGPSTPALAGLTLAERVRFGGLAFAEALRIVIWPVDAPPRYTPELLLRRGELLGVPFTATVGALAWLGLLVPALLVLTRRSVRGWTLGRGAALLVALAFLPVSQLVPIGEVFAPRFLYLPLLFATPLLLLAADLLSAAWRPALVSSLLLLLSIGCFVRAKDYADAGAWNRAVLREDPSDARAWNNLGLYHEACGDAGAAQAAWQRAAQLEPSYSKPWSNLGRLHFQAQDYELALVDWRRALELGPRNPVAHVNLASLLTRLDQHAQAEELYARATELAPGLSAAWRGLALARLRQGDLAGARSAWGRASQLDPTDRATQALEEGLLRAEQEAESRR